MISASIIVALVADQLFGEVRRFHPLVGFGRLANWLEACARRSSPAAQRAGSASAAASPARQRGLGIACWLLLVAVPTAAAAYLAGVANEIVATLAGIVVLYFCIGARSLAEHARAVAAPLAAGELELARRRLSLIVSRDTAQLDAQAVTKATLESVLENGSDAVLAPVFWFVIAGTPGVLCYRLANTLDAMWGYRNERFLYFGYAAARMDDVLNWFPARCCALAYAFAGQLRAALHCWKTQAAMCDSPNAGPVMAAGAGSLGVALGGTASYGNEPHWRPLLGEGGIAQPADIERALALLGRATGIWLLVIILCEYLAWI